VLLCVFGVRLVTRSLLEVEIAGSVCVANDCENLAVDIVVDVGFG
jgi:hypothetical protein